MILLSPDIFPIFPKAVYRFPAFTEIFPLTTLLCTSLQFSYVKTPIRKTIEFLSTHKKL